MAFASLGLPDIPEMLVRIAAGYDPRLGASPIKDFIEGVGEMPTPEEWGQLVELVADEPSFSGRTVTMDHSVKAMQTLIKHGYCVPRDVNRIEGSVAVAVTALTRDEITDFLQLFEGEF